jgi:hypothetical protein
MTTLQKTLITAAAAVLAGVGFYEPRRGPGSAVDSLSRPANDTQAKPRKP